MQQILVLSLIAVVDPVLFAAGALMLLLPDPKKLLLGFSLGALLTSIPIGLVIVFSAEATKAPLSTTKHRVDPGIDIAVGCGLLVISTLLATGVWARLNEWRKQRKGPANDNGPSRMQRALSKGSPRLTFGVGAVYEAVPSVVFLAAMHEVIQLNAHTLSMVFLVVFVCLAQLALVLAPLVSFTVAPDWTPTALESAKAWLSRDARKLAVAATAIVGAWLLVRGLITLLLAEADGLQPSSFGTT
jgi:hypothetical protein